MSSYAEFLTTKRFIDLPTGLDEIPDPCSVLFPFQADIVRWAWRRGRAAIFAGTGLGKTFMQCEWARGINGRVLIVAPLAVAQQTVREAERLGLNYHFAKKDDGHPVIVTNYEMLHHFDPGNFKGVVLDESSILKSHTGKFRNQLIDEWGALPFRLCLTATPAPNDFMELGNHAEFLGAMTRSEMLAHFFVHDGGETQKWRLKRHAQGDFWRWVCSWAVMLHRPSDLGYDDGDFELPPLHQHQEAVECDWKREGELFAAGAAVTLGEQREARKATIVARAERVAEMVNASDEPWLVWCDLNAESTALKKLIPDAIEVRGSDKPEVKEERMLGFSEGRYRVLVSKPSICGFGMNWQHCPNQAFTGLSHSWEQYYQAVRRSWRFGQKRHVHIYVVTSTAEGNVVANIQRKEREAEALVSGMIKHMADITSLEIKGTDRKDRRYKPNQMLARPLFLS